MNESYKQSRPTSVTVANYRLWVNEERTVLVRLWNDGTMEVATRTHRDDLWGVPFTLTEERV